MFSKIIIPVDMTETGTQEKAMDVASDLAKRHEAELHLVSVGGVLPTKSAHYSEKQLVSKMQEYANELSKTHGINAFAHEIHSADPAAEMNSVLLKAVSDIDADLVVMATHVPGFIDHFFSTHAGHMATHAKVSVFLVR